MDTLNWKRLPIKLSFSLIAVIVICFALNILVTTIPISRYTSHIRNAFINGDITYGHHTYQECLTLKSGYDYVPNFIRSDLHLPSKAAYAKKCNLVTPKLTSTYQRILTPKEKNAVLRGDNGFDAFRGQHQYEDCEILEAGLKMLPNFMSNALNTAYFGDATKCNSLKTIVFSIPTMAKKHLSYKALIKDLSHNPALGGGPIPYGQYLHGPRTMAVILVSTMSLRAVRFLYKNLNYFLIFAISIFCLFGEGFKQRRIAFSLCFYTIFSFFHGLDFFSMNLTYGPGGILTFASTLLMLYFLKKGKGSAFLTTIVIAGGLTAYFEKFTGILPSIACLIAITLTFAYSVEKIKLKEAIKYYILGSILFLFAFLITYFVFIFLKIQITGYSWHAFVNSFGLRVGDTVGTKTLSYPEVLARLLSRTFWISSGLFWPGLGVLLLSVVGLITTFFIKKYRVLSLFGAVPFIIIGVWFFIFQNHAFVHPWFMVRILSYCMFTGWFLMLCCLLEIPYNSTSS